MLPMGLPTHHIWLITPSSIHSLIIRCYAETIHLSRHKIMAHKISMSFIACNNNGLLAFSSSLDSKD